MWDLIWVVWWWMILDSVVLSGWILCWYWPGRAIHSVLYSLVVFWAVGVASCGQPLLCEWWVRPFSYSASYRHCWDPFRTGVAFVSRQEQTLPPSCMRAADSSQCERDWCDATTFGFRAEKWKEATVVLVSSTSKGVQLNWRKMGKSRPFADLSNEITRRGAISKWGGLG